MFCSSEKCATSDSIRFALTVAETGHLVFGSLHTNDTAQALARMVDVLIPSRPASTDPGSNSPAL